MNDIDYSVIVPVYNSEDSLPNLFSGIKKIFVDIGKPFEVIFIEDGSRDRSWEVLAKLKADNPRIITAIKLSKNYGQHNATFCGMFHSKGNYVITIDDDLQIPPAEIKKLITEFDSKKCDLVYGFFKNKKHGMFRNMGSYYMKTVPKILYKTPGKGSSFRMLSRDLALKILGHNQNFVFIDELLIWYTNNISFVEVDHEKRKYGRSGYSGFKLFQLAANTMYYYTALPLKIMTYGGLFSSLICFLIGLYYLAKKIFLHHAPPGYTSVIVAILFSTGVIIFSLGVIGEYLRRIYLVQNKKPPYIIKEILQ
jgi:glycosyltransferase involved in cell wall biosynthesis